VTTTTHTAPPAALVADTAAATLALAPAVTTMIRTAHLDALADSVAETPALASVAMTRTAHLVALARAPRMTLTAAATLHQDSAATLVMTRMVAATPAAVSEAAAATQTPMARRTLTATEIL
jgi:hypothetical protein